MTTNHVHFIVKSNIRLHIQISCAIFKRSIKNKEPQPKEQPQLYTITATI